jgi:8-oxo-dGTP pyrophosphatase MutT (NUDIX family)
VLVPIVENSGRPALVLTRRSRHLTHHKGEVSFPGGRLDPGEDTVSAALREAHEEIALHPSAVSVIGHLPSVTTYASNSTITPVVARVDGAPRLTINTAEVERVFTVTLEDLAAPGTFRQESWPIAGRPLPIHFYDLPEDILWGVTGRMVTHLLDVLTRP